MFSTLRRPTGWLLSAAMLGSCAVNPVTGRSELSLVSESQEIKMGREGAQQVVQSIGLYPDSALQAYVSGIGLRLAAGSERPGLPWSFQVLDDPAVNAFALPGGFIFVTRGILGHFTSEAELAAVLGHEIGHVTAKHSVRQISRAQAAQLGLGVGMILSDEVRSVGGALGSGLGLMFLKFGRDDENQADDLGFRYALANRYDVREMVSVFEMLSRVGGGGGRLPEWLSTHPNPENRIGRTQQRLAGVSQDLSGYTVNRSAFLQRTDGLVFGEDPRKGYFEATAFYHPELRFRFDFPSGWKTQNQAHAVIGVASADDAMVELTITGSEGPAAAAQQFFSQQGIEAGATSSSDINGLPARSGAFTARTQQAVVQGVAAFVAHGGSTYRILAYTTQEKYRSYEAALAGAVRSFRPLTDPAKLNVQPARIQLVRLPSAMTVAQFHGRYPSTVSLAQIALINGVAEDATLASGETVKRVVRR